MTGMFVRVKRDGKWCTIEIEYLTEAELSEAFKESDKERVIKFLAAVGEWMRSHLVDEEVSPKRP